MGWERGKYYTRSKKINGRVVREYVGKGVVGQFAADLDEATRLHFKVQRLEAKEQCQDLHDLDKEIGALDKQVDTVSKAAMFAAGYHQHARGQWRKRRGT